MITGEAVRAFISLFSFKTLAGVAAFQVALFGFILLWTFVCAVIYLSGGQDAPARAKRFLAALLGVAVTGAALFSSIVWMTGRIYLLPTPVGDLLSYGFFAGTILAPFILLPILAVSTIPIASGRSWIRAAAMGCLWFVFFNPPFPTRFAETTAASTAIGAVFGFLCFGIKWLNARIKMSDRRRMKIGLWGGVVPLVLFQSLFVMEYVRVPRPTWPTPVLMKALLGSVDQFLAQAARNAMCQLGPERRPEALRSLMVEFKRGDKAARRSISSAVTQFDPPAFEIASDLGAIVHDNPDQEARKEAISILWGLRYQELQSANKEAQKESDFKRMLKQLEISRSTTPFSVRAQEIMLEALKDPAPEVREWAANELKSFVNQKTTAALMKALSDKDPKVRAAVVTALRLIRQKEIDPRLINSWKLPLIEKLKIYGSTTPFSLQAQPLLIERLKHDPSPAVRGATVYALQPFFNQTTMVALIGALSDKNPPTPGNAAWVLSNVIGKSTDTVAPLLRQLLANSKDPALRGGAAWTLGQFRVEKAVPALLEAARREPDRDVRIKIFWALSLLDLNRSIPVFLNALEDSDIGVASQAAKILFSSKNDRARGAAERFKQKAVPILIHRLESAKESERARAAGALGALAARDGVPSLIRALKDPLPNVQGAASSALFRIGTPEAKAAHDRYEASQKKKTAPAIK